MQLGYYRVGAYRDAAESFSQILKLAPVFRLDNNLTNFGSEPYQPKLPINCVYDSWGAPGGFLRGLFEYEYLADGLTVYPHIPDDITRLEQTFPIYFGEKRIYFQTKGKGPVHSVLVNGKNWSDFDDKSIRLKLDPSPGELVISIGLGDEKASGDFQIPAQPKMVTFDASYRDISKLHPGYKPKSGILPTREMLKKLNGFVSQLKEGGFQESYEMAHAKLILESVQAIQKRIVLKNEGKIVELPEASQTAADQLYLDTLTKLYYGLNAAMEKNLGSESSNEKQIALLWKQIQ